MKLIKNIKILTLIFALVLVNGCGFWTDFTTYFNRYYNASKLFEEVESRLIANKKDIFEFKLEDLKGQDKTKLKKVIEKTSKIFQFQSESSYFPDALMLTGKAFYYQQDFSKALRKFNELLSLNLEDYNLETLLWIGKTQLQLREFDKGLETLDKVINLAAEEENEDILKEAYIAEIAFLTYRERVPEAIELCNKFLTVSDDDIINAKTSYHLGKLQLQLENLDEAIAAFEAVENYEPDFITEFNSKLQIAQIYRELGDTEKSLELLEDLKNENKFQDFSDKIDLEIGQIYYEKGLIEDAITQFAAVDSVYTNVETGGIASYHIGGILMRDYQDYDSAKIYFDKTLSSKAPFDIKTEARKESNLINKYLKLTQKLKKQKKQLLYATDDDAFILDSLAYEEALRKDTMKTDEESFAGNKQTNKFDKRKRGKNKKKEKKGPVKPVRPKISADSLYTLISNTEFELANIFFTEFNVPDSAYFYYTKSLEDNENNPQKPQILYALGSYYELIGDSTKADSVFEIIYENYKGNEIVNRVAEKLNLPEVQSQTGPAEKIYLSAETLIEENNFNDAIPKLKSIFDSYPKSTYAAKSLYAIGWLYENELDNPDSAAAYYDLLNTKFANSSYAKKIKTKIYFYKKELAKKKAAADTTNRKVSSKNLQNSSQANTVKATPDKNISKKTEKPKSKTTKPVKSKAKLDKPKSK